MTDLCYLACMRKLLAARPRIFPQFATHNALTVATVIEEAGGFADYEFQRLHGMGEALYAELLAEAPAAACRIYAPVGGHRDLLAYLVRRLLENGANSSFVSVAADPAVPIADILARPQTWIADPTGARHPKIPLPRDIYGGARKNSAGVEFGDRASLDRLLAEIRAAAPGNAEAAPLLDGVALPGRRRAVVSPIDGAVIGAVTEGDEAIVISAMAAATAGFPPWEATPREARAAALARAGDALEHNRGRLIALLQAEAGKTLDDAVAEVREAADFCRYYAAEARRALRPQPMPGPTGETNELRYRGRGVFVCISPWNFPLAIFTGQVAAALAAGNAVVAKPAEQTPLVATEAVRLLHAAGIPASALHLVPGDGRVGALLVADRRVAGVAFTGSTEVARAINRSLAAKDAPIVPLIAETGGINAMIADATALPEQVTDDVMASSFRSAGQRCSALRLLCVQDDVADRVIEMIAGAARELALGDPREVATHVGPVIDADAKARLDGWIADMESQGRVGFRWDRDRPLPAAGTFVPPTIVALDRAARPQGGGVRSDPSRRALPVGRARRAARRHRGERHRSHPRHPFAHRRDRRAHRVAAGAWQRLRQPQHDRRRGRYPAVRRKPSVRHRSEGGRPELSAALRVGAGGHGQHRGGRRQREFAGRGRVSLAPHPSCSAKAEHPVRADTGSSAFADDDGGMTDTRRAPQPSSRAGCLLHDPF